MVAGTGLGAAGRGCGRAVFSPWESAALGGGVCPLRRGFRGPLQRRWGSPGAGPGGGSGAEWGSVGCEGGVAAAGEPSGL